MEILSQEVTVTEIAHVVDEILKNKLQLDSDSWGNDKFNQSFMDVRVNMRARHLLTLYFEIEKSFGVSIPEEDIVTGRFKTINNIAVIIRNELDNQTNS
ncbi:hypothetical protein [Paenibacillus monticola]|uniref:Carrier domain-containing protein n=1 Tax=Paenibacillus monticola TaxID=2666075 RepID=A0A7X2HAH0_9BACL|nr:hypothetical protein [Paenibacillus monticola]MRN55833.1 hypothetical protein [Paenibacillus monticola]